MSTPRREPLQHLTIPTEESLGAVAMSASDTSIEMPHPDEDTVMAESAAPFRFLDLPTEIQCRIIQITLDMERRAFRPDQEPEDPLDTGSPRFYDFNINACALRCHSLPPFPLLFVNKYVSREALAIVYQNSSFAAYAEVSIRGVPDQAFGYIPKMVKNITPMMKENAREVTFHISTIDERPNGLGGNLNTIDNTATLKRAVDELGVLVSEATFPHVKTLNVVLLTQGLVQKHLNAIFKVFTVSGCIVKLEEVCNGDFGARGSKQDKEMFGQMVQHAAREWGQEWMWIEKPVMESTCGRGLWRGMRVSWARQRTWNRVFAQARTGLA